MARSGTDMKISGFSFARNAESLYYPVKESILSILPVCDEFIMVVGKSADHTRDIVASIHDPRLRIIDTEWPEREQATEHIFRQQANIGLRACTGDWCFHLQCDEIVHEDDLPRIRQQCQENLGRQKVEGMLLEWIHFWGDYEHFQRNHRFCNREIRIVRNRIGVESYKDSVSFRVGDRKLRVVHSGARIFHYGMVRPPDLMRRKQIAMDVVYHGATKVTQSRNPNPLDYDYGSLEKLPRFSGKHPAVMTEMISRFDWKDKLRYSGKSATAFKHDRLKYRLLTLLEERILGGRKLGGFRNYQLIK
jgi:hypothetical protein